MAPLSGLVDTNKMSQVERLSKKLYDIADQIFCLHICTQARF